MVYRGPDVAVACIGAGRGHSVRPVVTVILDIALPSRPASPSRRPGRGPRCRRHRPGHRDRGRPGRHRRAPSCSASRLRSVCVCRPRLAAPRVRGRASRRPHLAIVVRTPPGRTACRSPSPIRAPTIAAPSRSTSFPRRTVRGGMPDWGGTSPARRAAGGPGPAASATSSMARATWPVRGTIPEHYHRYSQPLAHREPASAFPLAISNLRRRLHHPDLRAAPAPTAHPSALICPLTARTRHRVVAAVGDTPFVVRVSRAALRAPSSFHRRCSAVTRFSSPTRTLRSHVLSRLYTRSLRSPRPPHLRAPRGRRCAADAPPLGLAAYDAVGQSDSLGLVASTSQVTATGPIIVDRSWRPTRARPSPRSHASAQRRSSSRRIFPWPHRRATHSILCQSHALASSTTSSLLASRSVAVGRCRRTGGLPRCRRGGCRTGARHHLISLNAALPPAHRRGCPRPIAWLLAPMRIGHR